MKSFLLIILGMVLASILINILAPSAAPQAQHTIHHKVSVWMHSNVPTAKEIQLGDYKISMKHMDKKTKQD